MSGYENVLSTVTPALTLKLRYGSKDVAEGLELKPSEVRHQPSVDWDADENALYTLGTTHKALLHCSLMPILTV